MLVTSRHFESYLKCPTKCWLQSRDEPPAGNPQSDSIQIMFTLMFAISSCRRVYSLLCPKLFSAAATEQGRRHDHETTVDHALMRGLVTAGPVMRRGASSV